MPDPRLWTPTPFTQLPLTIITRYVWREEERMRCTYVHTSRETCISLANQRVDIHQGFVRTRKKSSRSMAPPLSFQDPEPAAGLETHSPSVGLCWVLVARTHAQRRTSPIRLHLEADTQTFGGKETRTRKRDGVHGEPTAFQLKLVVPTGNPMSATPFPSSPILPLTPPPFPIVVGGVGMGLHLRLAAS